MNLSFLKNAGLGWTVAFCSLALAGWIFVKGVNVNPDVPPAPRPAGEPWIKGAEGGFVPEGEQVKLNVQMPEVLPKGFKSALVSWKISETKWNAKTGDVDFVDKANIIVLPDSSVIFATGVGARNFVVYAMVSFLSDDGGPQVKQFLLMIKIHSGKGPLPPPGPNPPEPPVPPTPPDVPVLPDGKFKLAKYTFDKVTILVPADASRKNLSSQLVANGRGIASAIAAGAFSTPEAALKEWGEKNLKLTKADVHKEQWDAFGDLLQAQLFILDNDRTFTDNIQNLRDAILEVSDGLEAVSKMK